MSIFLRTIWRNNSLDPNSMPNKTRARFIEIDIVESYPSITEKVLDKAVSYAQTVTKISDYIIQLIK